MSQATALLEPLDFDLVTDDGEPVESPYHLEQMNLILEGIRRLMAERGQGDYFAGANMFLYYSQAQARAVAEEVAAELADPDRLRLPPGQRPADATFRGPDVFFVDEVAGHPREAWVVWEEDQRFPDVIFEILSPSTASHDKGAKKKLYAHTFGTPEYFLWGPRSHELSGYRLFGSDYRKLRPNAEGRLWSRELGLYMGPWQGTYRRLESTWLRLFEPGGRMIPTAEELEVEAELRAEAADQRADEERQRADEERRRADEERRRAEAAERRADEAAREIARLRAQLGGVGD